MCHELREHYSRLSDEELLEIAGNGDDYRPEAVDAAKSELVRRGVTITEDRIQLALAERTRARKQLEVELGTGSGCLEALTLFASGRSSQAKTVFLRSLLHLVVLSVVMIVLRLTIALLARLLGE